MNKYYTHPRGRNRTLKAGSRTITNCPKETEKRNVNITLIKIHQCSTFSLVRKTKNILFLQFLYKLISNNNCVRNHLKKGHNQCQKHKRIVTKGTKKLLKL